MNQHVRVRQFDAETGEVLNDGCLVLVPQRAKIKEGWMMMFQDALVKLSTDRSMTQRHWRVLAYLLGKLDFENFIHVTQADVGRELEIAKGDVSKLVRDLVRRGIVISGPKVGNARTFRLSPGLGWKGRVRKLQEARRRHLSVVVSSGRPAGGAARPGRS